LNTVWILLALATNTQMGTYLTELDCKVAIQHRLVIDMISPPMLGDPIIRQRAEEIVAKTQQYQTSYACMPQGVDK
jgi:hypothetical protein